MTNIIKFRNMFFEDVGTKRWKRIVFCILVISIIWNFADWLSGSLTFKIWNEFLCLFLGIVAERLIPWGKTENQIMEKVREATKLAENAHEQNKLLLKTVKEQNDLLGKFTKRKEVK